MSVENTLNRAPIQFTLPGKIFDAHIMLEQVILNFLVVDFAKQGFTPPFRKANPAKLPTRRKF